jgi:DNA modification methylase
MVRAADAPHPTPNRLLQADALDVARALPAEGVDLVYLDPPFFTGRTRRGRGEAAFGDRWEGGLDAYLAWIEPLLDALREGLAPTGSIYVHLDWHAVHYVKVRMDRIFGPRQFLNEIVWLYGLGGSSRRCWPRKHDTILWYARRAGLQWFEAPQVPARSRRLRGQTKKAPDWWDLPALNNMARERTGYPTQKPEALLARIVTSSCPPGGLVVDPCCGSGTTGAAAHAAGRAWWLADRSPHALEVARARLRALRASFVEELPARSADPA